MVPTALSAEEDPGEPENNWIYDQSVFSILFLVSPIASRTRPPYADTFRTYTPETFTHLSFMYSLSLEQLWRAPCSSLPIISSQPGLTTPGRMLWKDDLCQGTMEHRYRETPSRCAGKGSQRHHPLFCSSSPGAAVAQGDAAGLCSSCFG